MATRTVLRSIGYALTLGVCALLTGCPDKDRDKGENESTPGTEGAPRSEPSAEGAEPSRPGRDATGAMKQPGNPKYGDVTLE